MKVTNFINKVTHLEITYLQVVISLCQLRLKNGIKQFENNNIELVIGYKQTFVINKILQ